VDEADDAEFEGVVAELLELAVFGDVEVNGISVKLPERCGEFV
jgi:hypothetical protein